METITCNTPKYKNNKMVTANQGLTQNINYLAEFLKSRQTKKDNIDRPVTNTRIGNEDAGIYGGSYHISKDEYNKFLELYYKHIFEGKNSEYLTEKQLENDGPLLIDIDMRFPSDTTMRVYTEDHIQDVIDIYLGILVKIYQFDDDTKFNVFLFEKQSVRKDEKSGLIKDGVHIIIGLKVDRLTQKFIRIKAIELISEAWEELGLVNDWEDVFDAGITNGSIGWQLIGSTKPMCQPYVLTRVLEITYDSGDENYATKLIKNFDLKKNFPQLSARYSDHPSLFYRTEYIKERDDMVASGKISEKTKKQLNAQSTCMLKAPIYNQLNIFKVKNREELQIILAEFLDSINDSVCDYELKEAYEYTMTLPDTYYGNGSYSKWIRVGWALRNISDRLFIVWIVFSSQSSSFSFSDIPEFYDMWMKFDLNNTNGLRKGSIMHWSRLDAREKYKAVRENSIDYYIDLTLNNIGFKDMDVDSKSIKGCGDFDLAMVLYHLFKDEFVCVSVKSNIWYTYKKHRWEEIDSGTTLRKAISTELREVYRKKITKTFNETTTDKTNETREALRVKSEKILDICIRLGRTNDKKNIMTEAKELFYDGSFLEKLDTNPYLLCYNNGVIDFKTKTFRRGCPEDFISKCTNIDYRPIDRNRDKKIINELEVFMSQLFPIKELNEYMWDHLASSLIGISRNQTFNMYIGVGQNGKSVLTKLMKDILGEYFGEVPLPLITDKRAKIGGLTPEIVQLKGIRYAVLNEPDKHERINVGMMKQLTSGVEEISGRAPYMTQTISFVPQFKMVLCSNEFMEIKSTDHGTWRRIRVVDFMSLFTENPVSGDKDRPHQFKIDTNLDHKFEVWKQVFSGLLVEKVFVTDGYVKDCPIVLKASNSYRQSQDYIAEFISDKIMTDNNGSITKTELTAEFSIWYQGIYGKGGPSPKDVQAYMDKRFGKYELHKCWRGCRINYDQPTIVDGLDDNDNNSNDELEEIDEGEL
jgi:P4 family phage/plasmid primase-like protien